MRPGRGIRQAHRLHRPVPQRLAPALRHDLDRKTPLEVDPLLEVVDGHGLAREQVGDELLVLLARQRAVPVVLALALAVARHRVHLREVERVGDDDRRDRVVEVEVLGPEELADRARRAPATSAGPSRGRRALGRGISRTSSRTISISGQRRDRLRDGAGEDVAVHRERVARRQRRRARATRMTSESSASISRFRSPTAFKRVVGPEGVGADELGEAVRLVRRRRDLRPHLEEPHAVPAPRELPGALGAREAGARRS